MSGPKELMVTKASAERVGHLSRDIDHLPSNSDHRGLVRFEHSQDARYRSTVRKLAKLASEAASRATLHVADETIGPDVKGNARPQQISE